MKFLEIIPQNTNIDFIGKFWYFVTFSVVTLIVIVTALWTHGLNYGIDFTGGTVIRAKFTPPLEAQQIRQVLADLGEPDASVVALEKESHESLITVRRAEQEKNAVPLNQKLIAKLGPDHVSISQVDHVGPKVGKELKMAAMLSLFYSVILITIYIWLRFDIRFAPGATIAMVHDLVMSTGFYLLTGREFTITAIAALLTIAGYSVNDTIVVYDRVREMIKKAGGPLPLPETINKAVNITLSRTLLTSGVTLISIVPITFFCKGEIQSFALAMCFGIFVGTYSTVYIASPCTIYIERLLDRKKKGPIAPRTQTA